MQQPLAERMRPQKLSDVVGQEQVVGKGKLVSPAVLPILGAYKEAVRWSYSSHSCCWSPLSP